MYNQPLPLQEQFPQTVSKKNWDVWKVSGKYGKFMEILYMYIYIYTYIYLYICVYIFHNTIALYAKESSGLSKCHTENVDRELNSRKRALVEIVDIPWKFLLVFAVAVTSF